MSSDLGTVTVFPVDLGVDCALVPLPDLGETVLVVRPHPHQTFDSAVERANRILPCPPDEVRALLRPHFPTPTAMHTPQIGEPAEASTRRRAIRRLEKRRRLVYWALAGLAGIIIGGLVSFTGHASMRDQPPTAGPLLTDQTAATAIDVWDVDCSITSGGWEAACQGDTVGAFTLRAYYAPDQGVLFSSRVGKSALMMNLFPHQEDARESWQRMATSPEGPAVLLTHPDQAAIVMWGEPDYVAALTGKALALGYQKAEDPAEAGPPDAAVAVAG